MGSNEKFCLRWNDFETNISVAFREIREEKDFFDCTLSCGSRQIQAHKLILSACSPFFRSVLKQNPHQHPLLYLKGVEFGDLQAVLNFMYHGEVNVAQEELNSFLSVAEELKVKGLTQNNATESSASKPKPFKPEPAPPQIRPTVQKPVVDQSHVSTQKPRQRSVVAPQPSQSQVHYQEQHDDDIQEVVPVVKQEPVVADHVPVSHPVVSTMPQQHHYQEPLVAQHGTAVASMDESYGDAGYDDYEGYEGEGYDEGAMMTSGAGADPNKGVLLQGASQLCQKHDEKNFECLSCGKMFSDQSNCKRHIRHNHLGEERNATCPHCNKVELRTNMKRHLKKYCVNRHLYVEDAEQLEYY